MSDDGHDHDHNHVDPPSFPIQVGSIVWLVKRAHSIHHVQSPGHPISPIAPTPRHVQTNSSIIGFLVFFLAYYLSYHTPFAYVENDTAALAAKSAR